MRQFEETIQLCEVLTSEKVSFGCSEAMLSFDQRVLSAARRGKSDGAHCCN